MAELLYPEMSYQLMGVLFEVHNKLGTKFQEKHYQRAIAFMLNANNIPFQKEYKVSVEFEGAKLGDFYLDFVIDNKIVLETKMIYSITDSDVKQVLRYLDATKLKLGIIANFKHPKLEYKRIVL